MITRPPEQADAERAVMAYKHAAAVRVMRYIVTLALRQPYVFPGDVPVGIVSAEHRQGVVSNAWGSLDALEIIAKLPLNFMDETAEIFGGRKCNKNAGAKSRWCAVYRLRSATAARTWLERNPDPTRAAGASTPVRAEQTELVMA